MIRRVSLLLALLLFLVPAEARADPPANDGVWGWWLVAGGVAAGATITTVSLTRDCTPADTRCAQWTAFGIWTGVGVAAAGAVAGLVVVENGARRSRVAIGPGGIVGTF